MPHTIALLCLLLTTVSVAFAQQPQPSPSAEPDDILRINTELVQTDLMVFDKSGRFVDDLKQEHFELRVDGKPQQIAFFDLVTAGSATEEAQLAAARGVARPAEDKNKASVGVLDRGRTVIFFVDDLHLTADSLSRTKKTLLRFIDSEMGQNDQVAIATTSGQLGFLQQLTDNKTVLRTAVERMGLQAQQMADGQRPPMSEHLAQEIIVRYNQEVLQYYIDALIKDGVPPNSPNIDEMVRSRARAILDQANAVTRNTFIALENLARTIAPLPGRKLVFFLSEGFLLNTNETATNEKLLNITNVAARNGVVIYTMDARGLVVDPSSDASQPSTTDFTGRIQTAAFGELTAMQTALRTLADNTGGRALLNSNSLDAGITKTLKETSTYYVISWRPESEEQKSDKLRRIEVKIKGRPELNVQVKRGYLGPPRKPAAKTATAPAATDQKNSKPKTPADEIRAAITSFHTSSGIPTSLSLDYIDSPKNEGAMLTIAMQIPAEALAFEPIEGKFRAQVDVAGFVYNDKGQTGVSFQERLTANADSMEVAHERGRAVYYASNVRLAPGLYQVRVASRDVKSGRIGTAVQWVEIPDLKSKRLTLSSLMVGEMTAAQLATQAAENEDGSASQAQLNVARRFSRTSRLRFVTFIYNATRGASGTTPPDVAIQVQVLRDNQPVLTTALRKVATEGLSDLARLPYAAEIPLANMREGRYVLQVLAIDRAAKTSATQRIRFEVE
ncbi:MAG: VWA domain-containing protein [Pyrinomonadaceae bacterium]|nr:VWA domain-containing protein [Pyrinomonadaceae bacterium]